MTKQLHKRFSAEQVKALFQKYLHEGIELIYILETLKIKKSRFFQHTGTILQRSGHYCPPL